MLAARGSSARPSLRRPSIRQLVDLYVTAGILLDKPTVTLYEDVQDFWVAEDEARLVGCGALHVMWEDLAEIRTSR